MNKFQKLLLVVGTLLVISLSANIYLLLTNNNIIQYSYLPNDIMRVDYRNMDVYFENGGDPLEFSNITDLTEYVAETTAYASCIHGYKDNLDWLIRQGYIYAKTVHNDDEQYTDLIYNGPNWTVNAEQDTSYIISTFNNVEKLWSPKTNTVYYESYTID